MWQLIYSINDFLINRHAICMWHFENALLIHWLHIIPQGATSPYLWPHTWTKIHVKRDVILTPSHCKCITWKGCNSAHYQRKGAYFIPRGLVCLHMTTWLDHNPHKTGVYFSCLVTLLALCDKGAVQPTNTGKFLWVCRSSMIALMTDDNSKSVSSPFYVCCV